jgi:hypothetical protein
MQRLCRLSQIQVAARCFLNKAKLVEVHTELQLKNRIIMRYLAPKSMAQA